MAGYRPIYATDDDVERVRQQQERARQTQAARDGAAARRGDPGVMILLAVVVGGLLTMVFGRFF